jgi:hypothetical protein
MKVFPQNNDLGRQDGWQPLHLFERYRIAIVLPVGKRGAEHRLNPIAVQVGVSGLALAALHANPFHAEILTSASDEQLVGKSKVAIGAGRAFHTGAFLRFREGVP